MYGIFDLIVKTDLYSHREFEENKLGLTYRNIPDQAFGVKPIVRIRDIDAVVHNYLLFKEKADKTGSICAAVLKAEVHG